MIDGSGMCVVEVRFGDVSGIKCVSKIAARKLKRVYYALDVPGGFLTATIDSSSKDFDESEFERYFHTMQVLNYPPPELN